LQQIIKNLKECEDDLNQEYDALATKGSKGDELSIALQKIIVAIEQLDDYSS
jgi:hypothetical protein